MAMTQTQIRIDGAVKRIDKIHSKIERLKGLIVKKQARIESGKEENSKYPSGEYYLQYDIKHHEEDIERAKRDLASEEKKLALYREKRKSEIDKDNSIPRIESVEKFLAIWKENADKYYREEVKALREWKSEYRIYYKEKRAELKAEFGYRVNCVDKEVEAREKELKIDWKYEKSYISNRWTVLVAMLSDYEGEAFDKRLDKFLSDEVDSKRADLFFRCSRVVGLITDASGLRVASNCSLNGFVVGEEGKAEVETIYAGGHHIQCLHYRVLVKPIGAKK